MRERIKKGKTPEERAYVEMLTREDREEGNQRLPGYRLLEFTTRTYVETVIQKTKNGELAEVKVRRARRTPQEKILVRMPDGKAFVPYESGKNGTDKRASEALGERVPHGGDIRARDFIKILREQERQRVLEKTIRRESTDEKEEDMVAEEREWRF